MRPNSKGTEHDQEIKSRQVTSYDEIIDNLKKVIEQHKNLRSNNVSLDNLYAKRLPVIENGGSRILYLKVEQINWIKAENQYMRLYIKEKSYLVRMASMTLRNLSKRLDPSLFQQVHRSHIVNLENIVSLNIISTEKRFVELSGGRQVPVSSVHWPKLKKCLVGYEWV